MILHISCLVSIDYNKKSDRDNRYRERTLYDRITDFADSAGRDISGSGDGFAF